MRWLSDEDHEALIPAERCEPRTPLPVRMVASEEYLPVRQTAKQRETEARLYAMADEIAPKLGLSRRRFFQTSAGMAAGFAALNGAFGPLFVASEAEARTPELAQERAEALSGQFIMDMHTHFLRDDTRLENFVRLRESVAAQGWNPQLTSAGPQTLEDLKFDNYFKEIFLDSDTKISLISSAPSDIPEDWFLTNRQMAEARETVNGRAGSARLMTHAIFTPGAPGWLDDLDAALALRPDSVKGYTVGDNTHKETARYPWRMDSDETYRGYEKMAAAGVRNVCVHKGLWGRGADRRFPNLAPYADVRDVAQAAKDWPQLNFIIYHSAYRLDDPEWALADRADRTDRLGHGPGGNPGGARGEQRLRRPRADLRPDAGGAAANVRGDHGHAGQRPGRRPRLLGHGCSLDRQPAVADRGAATAGNSRGHAADPRFRAAGRGRRAGEGGGVRRQQCAAVRRGRSGRAGGAGGRPVRGAEDGVCVSGGDAFEPALRLRGAGLASCPTGVGRQDLALTSKQAIDQPVDLVVEIGLPGYDGVVEVTPVLTTVPVARAPPTAGEVAMPRPRARRRRWRATVETTLIVGLALVVVIKGSGAASV